MSDILPSYTNTQEVVALGGVLSEYTGSTVCSLGVHREHGLLRRSPQGARFAPSAFTGSTVCSVGVHREHGLLPPRSLGARCSAGVHWEHEAL
jgi:hypothetical protein